METETVVGTPETAAAAAPESQAVPVAEGTPENTGGQATAQAEGATAEESFTAIDPKTLPPELQAVHKSLLADYTKKTMAIAEKAKQFGEIEKKASAYDTLTADQRFKEYWSNLDRKERSDFRDQKAEAEKRLGEKISDTDFAKAFESKDSFLEMLGKVVEDKRAQDQQKIAQLEQKVSLNEAADAIEQVASEIDKKTGQPVRSDFYSLDEDQLITGYLSVNPATNPSEYRGRVMEAYNWAKSVANKYFEAGKADALKIINTKALNSSEPPTVTAKGAYTGPDPKKVDVAEAVALARKGIRVPQS